MKYTTIIKTLKLMTPIVTEPLSEAESKPKIC